MHGSYSSLGGKECHKTVFVEAYNHCFLCSRTFQSFDAVPSVFKLVDDKESDGLIQKINWRASEASETLLVVVQWKTRYVYTYIYIYIGT